MTRADTEDLETRLGHRFNDRELLSRALTHPSSNSDTARNNQRLEFLGDRVLSLIIADMLIARFPDSTEGDLAPRLNALVRRDAIAGVAREIGLAGCVIMAAGEQASGGRDKPAILADACEALIAALYLDGGLEAARNFIQNLWGPLLGQMTTAPADAKSALQEWTQARKLGIPAYRIVSREGPDHAPQFIIEVAVTGLPAVSGSGASKREAEQQAASMMLESIKPYD